LNAKQIGTVVPQRRHGGQCDSLGEQVLEVELPNSVVLEIVQTEPGKGDTATGGTKPAIVETGAQVMVLFIKMGERIRIDTRNDTYLGRE